MAYCVYYVPCFLLSRHWQALISTHGVTMVVSWWLSHKEAPPHTSSESNCPVEMFFFRTGQKKNLIWAQKRNRSFSCFSINKTASNTKSWAAGLWPEGFHLNPQTAWGNLESEAHERHLLQWMWSLFSRSRLRECEENCCRAKREINHRSVNRSVT